MSHCSVPDIGKFRTWFNENFHDICEEHDIHYTLHDVWMLEADLKAIRRIVRRRPDKAVFLMAILVIFIWYIYPVAIYRWYAATEPPPSS